MRSADFALATEPAEDAVPAILPSIRGAGLTARAAQGAVTSTPDA
jgi:hypothetical protein